MTPGKTGAARVPADGLRRAPQQARSRARVEAILSAARQILDAGGVENLTIRKVADRAGVPTGTVYQFFEDKSALLTAVARRYMDASAAAINALVEQASTAPWPELIDNVIDGYVELYRRNPGYLAIRTGRHLTAELLASDAADNDGIADGLRHILVAREGLVDGPALRVACRTGVHTVDALLHLAFRTAPEGDPATIAEAKRIVTLYLTESLADPRYRS
ncbi:TetR/AcrR family transcriptional regulator [Actinomadura viridis]|uniref:AcrR family transcriptional regulator n=1 Tax=Actinomadura viridis TaxID=58110 RepID=A0A931GMV3_9ACTN|nr:TetR/AcrR family transcriptional regulator [Actinomadura viridis]MBG6088866.1 AcrR family transcriptional regulator [Actinomadura viridis]